MSNPRQHMTQAALKLPNNTEPEPTPSPKPGRDAKGRLLPGYTANPSGISQFTNIQELARSHGRAMINVLVKIAKSKNAPAAARGTCAVAVLNRAYGAPAAFSTSSPEAFRKAVDLTDDELAAIVSAGRGKVLELVAKAARPADPALTPDATPTQPIDNTGHPTS